MNRRRLTRDEQRAVAAYAHREGVSAAVRDKHVSKSTVYRCMKKYPGRVGQKGTPTLPRFPVEPPEPPPPKPPSGVDTTVRSDVEDGTDADSATDADSREMKGWLTRSRKRRKAVRELKAIIARWEQSQGTDTVDGHDRSRASGKQVDERQASRSSGSSERQAARRSTARSSRLCCALVLDAGLLAALASDEYYAWKLLERSADGLHVLIVPHDVASRCCRDAEPNEHVKSVLSSRYVKRVKLNPEQMATARSLCCKTDETFDLLDGVAVVTARVYVRMLSRRRFRKRFAPHLVTREMPTMTKLIRSAGMRVVHHEPYHNTWSLLHLSLNQASTHGT